VYASQPALALQPKGFHASPGGKKRETTPSKGQRKVLNLPFEKLPPVENPPKGGFKFQQGCLFQGAGREKKKEKEKEKGKGMVEKKKKLK
jgi:hypothetical protein